MTEKEINAQMELLKKKTAELKALPEAEKIAAFHNMLVDLDEDDEVYESFIDTLKMKSCLKREFEYCESFIDYGSKQAIKRANDYPGIVLTTAHSSKGLEWNIVFNSITKYDTRDIKGQKMIEEKRRLLFVSATRARDELYVSGVYTAYTDKEYGETYNKYLVDCYNVLGLEFVPEKASKKKKDDKDKKPKKETVKKVKTPVA